MPAVNRRELVEDMVEATINEIRLAQGYPDEFEFAVALGTTVQKGVNFTTWTIMLSLDSGLISKPPHGYILTLVGERPTIDTIAMALAPVLLGLWQVRLHATSLKSFKKPPGTQRSPLAIPGNPN